jgi:hypothetical protein
MALEKPRHAAGPVVSRVFRTLVWAERRPVLAQAVVAPLICWSFSSSVLRYLLVDHAVPATCLSLAAARLSAGRVSFLIRSWEGKLEMLLCRPTWQQPTTTFSNNATSPVPEKTTRQPRKRPDHASKSATGHYSSRQRGVLCVRIMRFACGCCPTALHALTAGREHAHRSHGKKAMLVKFHSNEESLRRPVLS